MKGHILETNLEYQREILTLFLFTCFLLTRWLRYPQKIESNRKGRTEIENWGTSAHSHWGFQKTSCSTCLLFCYVFFDEKKRIATKGSIFFIAWQFNSCDYSNYGIESRKTYTPRLLLMCLENGRVLMLFCQGGGANDLSGRRKGLPLGLGLGEDDID